MYASGFKSPKKLFQLHCLAQVAERGKMQLVVKWGKQANEREALKRLKTLPKFAVTVSRIVVPATNSSQIFFLSAFFFSGPSVLFCCSLL